MSEDELDKHGDKTLNAAGVCLQNPFAAMIAMQQEGLRSVFAIQVTLVTAVWSAVLK